jgi:hypothetical protein
MTIAATLVISGAALIQDTLAQDCVGCQSGCCDRNGLIGNVELTFMKFMQEGGVADADGAGANFDLECAPRFELGYMGRRDLGLRSRYWSYDAATTSTAGNALGVNAYYVDLEFFHERRIGRETRLDFSLGLRYLDFKQDSQGGANLINSEFEGWGATIGLAAKYPLLIGNVYARARWSVLLGNGDMVVNGGAPYSAHDTTSSQTELGVGLEFNRDLGDWGTGSLRLGGEWQAWDSVAPGDAFYGGIGNDDVLENAGFAGVLLGLEVRR